MLKILTGPNSWLIKRAIAEFDTADISRYQGSELTPGELANILGAQSLFSTKRTIVIDELSANKASWEHLTELANELASEPNKPAGLKITHYQKTLIKPRLISRPKRNNCNSSCNQA